jgi:hypothetical protein
VRIYGRDQAEDLAEVTCLWYGCLDVITVRVILARDAAATLALVTTDLDTPAAALVERYAARWSIEKAFADARNILGAGEARNRTRRAAEPWYTAKTEPAFEDMLTKLRRVMICARISGGSPAHPEPAQIRAVLAAWHAAAA